MTNPTTIGPSSVFLSGDDADAKAETARLLNDLGWKSDDIVDLGGIDTARGPEHYFFLFFRPGAILGSTARHGTWPADTGRRIPAGGH